MKKTDTLLILVIGNCLWAQHLSFSNDVSEASEKTTRVYDYQIRMYHANFSISTSKKMDLEKAASTPDSGTKVNRSGRSTVNSQYMRAYYINSAATRSRSNIREKKDQNWIVPENFKKSKRTEVDGEETKPSGWRWIADEVLKQEKGERSKIGENGRDQFQGNPRNSSAPIEYDDGNTAVQAFTPTEGATPVEDYSQPARDVVSAQTGEDDSVYNKLDVEKRRKIGIRQSSQAAAQPLQVNMNRTGSFFSKLNKPRNQNSAGKGVTAPYASQGSLKFYPSKDSSFTRYSENRKSSLQQKAVPAFGKQNSFRDSSLSKSYPSNFRNKPFQLTKPLAAMQPLKNSWEK
ncbi:MAG: hypothetical protein GKR87_04710 [Kiritimatiellae bacterium]|nr:hypothetical protein [Kiritimatiellia bacterium]